MKLRIIILIFLMAFKISAQDFVNENINDDTLFNHLISNDFSRYCYNSDRVSELLAQIPKKNNYQPVKISETDFNSLNAFEHFVYSFSHPEWYYQSCSMFGVAEDIFQKIPALLKRQGEGLRMSLRQQNAIIQHRDSTLILMKECIEKRKKVSDEFTRYIISTKAFELIPTLISTIDNQEQIKDPFILTTLCLLMRFDYEPFRKSEIYNTLYPTDSNETDAKIVGFKNSIPFTHRNYKMIIDFASDYFEYKNNAPSEFVKLTGGTYNLGQKGHTINPIRKVDMKPFQISRYEITNKQFKIFVESTDYITLAEQRKDAFVFRLGLDEFEWIQDTTANWRYPNGVSKGGIDEKMNHPVTCISFIDAEAYCNWANVRLPTIEEWEVASRAGNNSGNYFFGDNVNDIKEYANIWHGKTHLMKYEDEDYITTSPVGSYKSNQIGLFDIYGNVFEFCSNTPKFFNAFDNVVATRGGSWWCSMYACGFFNSIDIGRVQKEATFSNNGFRVVR